MNLELLRCHSPSIRSMCAPKSRMAHDSLMNIYIYKHANVYVHANMYVYIYIYIYRCTANRTWDDIFESSLKAQS